MKIKTNELTRLALNWAVAKCVYPELVWGSSIGVHHASHQIVIPHLPELQCYWNPLSNWAQAGPIIEREIHAFDHMQSDRVTAIIKRKDMNNGGFTHGYGPTPLIAAMRCYVASKMGDEIDVPTELGESK